jgi:hypothetical protein
VQSVRPEDLVVLHAEISAPRQVERISLHLLDDQGLDRGSLGEATLTAR